MFQILKSRKTFRASAFNPKLSRSKFFKTTECPSSDTFFWKKKGFSSAHKYINYSQISLSECFWSYSSNPIKSTRFRRSKIRNKIARMRKNAYLEDIQINWLWCSHYCLLQKITAMQLHQTFYLVERNFVSRVESYIFKII